MIETSHASEPDYGMHDKKLSVYIVGILLCVILTLLPFGVVMNGHLPYGEILGVILVSALLQFFVQVFCFLRLNYSTEQAKMNTMSFLFSLVILGVVVGGSLWIMWTLNYRMMH